jgi:predicted flap endonuclease-1-like 5' DNA nuclease
VSLGIALFLLGALAGWFAYRHFGHRYSGMAASTQVRTPVEPEALDYAAARAAGFVVCGADNLEVIEGIGPRIAQLLRQNGVSSFAELATMSQPALRAVLEKGGPRFRIANPGTWPEQAALAAANRWEDLRALQDELHGGVRRA